MNHDLLVCIFPRLAAASCNLLHILIGSLQCFRPLSLVRFRVIANWFSIYYALLIADFSIYCTPVAACTTSNSPSTAFFFYAKNFSVDENWLFFTSKLKAAIEKWVPKKQVKSLGTNDPKDYYY